MFLLTFLVPESHLEITKNAIFSAGAGRVGHYAQCAWQTLGQGQFLPLEGNHAFIGQTGQLEQVSEYKVETICNEANIQAVVAALKLAHPYEEPSYQVIKLENI